MPPNPPAIKMSIRYSELATKLSQLSLTCSLVPSDLNNAVQNALALYKEKQGAIIKQSDMLSGNDGGTTPWLERTQFP